MTTSFTSLPVIDLSVLGNPEASLEDLTLLGKDLCHVFSTTGFAYLVKAPLSFTPEEVLGMAKDFFNMADEEKKKLARKTFMNCNTNTYRGYFPTQAGADNLKAGFEIGPVKPLPTPSRVYLSPFNLTEPNVWPTSTRFPHRQKVEELYGELQALSVRLLSLLALTSSLSPSKLTTSLENSISTLRFLHYPSVTVTSSPQAGTLSCTPHTDSGLLTLLHQDPTGGLEVLNASGEWVSAPYLPGSMVVNIGDLMARASGGEFVATYHRVRRSEGKERFSVPFFCEPGVDAVVGDAETYGNFVLSKMAGWVEFQQNDLQKNVWVEGATHTSVELGE